MDQIRKEITEPEKESRLDIILDRCSVLMKRNSVLEGLRERYIVLQSQSWTESRTVERKLRIVGESEAEKE